MNERDAFIRRICEEPDDDTVRLVFADWLQENREPERAEFIRLQIAWSATGDCRHNTHIYLDGTCRQCERRFRIRELKYRIHDPAGYMDADEVDYVRGFWETVRLPLAAFLEHAATIFHSQPVTRVVLTDAVVFPSGGNNTYYAGNLGVFPSNYWMRLDGLPTERAVRDALIDVCVDYGRSLVKLPPLPASSSGTAARSH